MFVTWLHRHPRQTDWALVLFTFATVAAETFRRHGGAAWVPFGVAAALPLLARRRYPLPVLAVGTAATIAAVLIWGAYAPFPAAIALYTVANRCERRPALAAGVVAVAAIGLALWGQAGWERGVIALGRSLPFVVAWVVGESIGIRRRYVEALEERAERLQRERAAEAARAVAEEQARIARELHDVVAHSLSVIVVQAAAAGDVFARRPERVREALRAIEQTGRSALDELRRLVGSVRGEAVPYAPQPGLALLDELAERVRATGLDVLVSVEGSPRPLPAALELSAYRVVQEALTNTLKHANASRAEVLVRYADGELDVEVRDDGRGVQDEPVEERHAGQGLVGMRERLGLLGGSFSAGPAEGGGFSVSARFPTAAPA